jgi:hypothetical protein
MFHENPSKSNPKRAIPLGGVFGSFLINLSRTPIAAKFHQPHVPMITLLSSHVQENLTHIASGISRG